MKLLKKPYCIFAIIVFLISSIIQYFIIKSGGIEKSGYTGILMFTPGFVGLVLARFFKISSKELGIFFKKDSRFLIAYIAPALIATITFFVLLLFDISTFKLSNEIILKFRTRETALFVVFVLFPTLGVLAAMINAAGEEIGWRGFLDYTLKEDKIKFRPVIIGIIWALWHLPLFLFTSYSNSSSPLISYFLFSITVIFISIFYDFIKANSHGSIWPCIVAHASHNIWFQGVFPAITTQNIPNSLFRGESGITALLLYFILFLFVKLMDKRAYNHHIESPAL
jgi:membrane protease YdiL (CAAX protease family)